MNVVTVWSKLPVCVPAQQHVAIFPSHHTVNPSSAEERNVMQTDTLHIDVHVKDKNRISAVQSSSSPEADA
jgi:hypothetical protein